MSPRNSRVSVPSEFSVGEKAKAEFWAWLVDGYAVFSSSADKRSGKSKLATEQRIVVVSKEEIKALIQEALRGNDQFRAHELLETASTPPPQVSNEMVRKSIRVGSGEYARLLYLKILERTSFADIIMKVLLASTKELVLKLKSQFYGHSFTVANRLDHLISLIETWVEDKPESRARAANWGSWGKERPLPTSQPIPANEWDIDEWSVPEGHRPTYYLEPFYQNQDIERVKTAFINFMLTDLLIKASGDDSDVVSSKLYEEFKEEWRNEMDKRFESLLYLCASVDQNSPDLLFTLGFYVTTSFNADRELELFAKYGQEEVMEFVNKLWLGGEPVGDTRKYEGITTSKEYKQEIASMPLDPETGRHLRVTIGTDVEFPVCIIRAKDPSSIEPEYLVTETPPALDKDKKLFESLLRKIADRIGYNDATKIKLLSRPFVPLSDSDFIKEAINKATGSEDFKDVNKLLMINNRFRDYAKITAFGEDLVLSTLRRYSVVSFYVNPDIWRLLPLVLENKNWITLVDEYLKNIT